ncbi:Serine/threonine-protein kinase ulk3, partial [Nowakowskiella sp. JEL0078]
MAPEVLISKQYDARCDLWSVGVIFYEMIVGVPPFNDSSTVEELLKNITSPIPHFLSLPDSLSSSVSTQSQNLVQHLLNRSPEKRISFSDFFNHPLIDIEFLPRPDSFNRGMDFVVQAVKRDEQSLTDLDLGNSSIVARNIDEIENISELYLSGINHLMSYIQYLTRPGAKRDEYEIKIIQKRIKEYLERVELIKEAIKRYSGKKSSTSDHTFSFINLVERGVQLSRNVSNEDLENQARILVEEAQRLEKSSQKRKAIEIYDIG